MKEPFHAYDIRSIYGAGIDVDVAYRIGRALAQQLDARRYLLGHDARTHSPELLDAVARGLFAEGRRLSSVGLTTTPALHFLQLEAGYDAAVMATASHNPPEYHGFKVFDASGGGVSYAKGLGRVEELMSEICGESDPSEDMHLDPAPAPERYVDFIVNAVGRRPLVRAVVDVSNGSSGSLVQAVSDQLGGFATVINGDPDGTFPSHPPNPLEEESHRDVSRAVQAANAAFGAILDGDGDRVLFFDELGDVIDSPFTGALLARAMLQRNPGAAIVHDLISSRVFGEEVKASGGIPVRSPVGYTNLFEVMAEHDAAFGCETSGHVYFRITPDCYTESALYAVVVLADLLDQSGGMALSQLVEPLRSRYSQSPEINLPLLDPAEGQAAIERIRRHYHNANLDSLDGLSVAYNHFWFTVRPSNTEPLMRLRIEGRDAATVEAALKELRAVIGSEE